MKTTHLFLSFLFLFVVFSCISQDRLNGEVDSNHVSHSDYAQNNIYLELGGKGLFYSINYERGLFDIGDKFSFRASVGFSIFPGLTKVKPSKDYFLPLEVSLLHHLKGNHFLSYGVGSTYWNYQVNNLVIDEGNLNVQPLRVGLKTIEEWFGHINIDYRHQKPKGGFMFKAGITPLFFAKMQNFQKVKRFALSGNIGVGYTF